MLRHRKHQGGVLVSTLIFVVITSLILAGIGTYTISHLSRASAEADYSASVNLAEAGINYELRNISENTLDTTRANQMHPAAGQSGPYTSSISGVSGSFSVAVTNDPDNGKAWYAPSNMLVTATGTLNGVTRTVRVRGSRRSIFDNYSFYGIDSTTIGGSLVADGSFGTNSPVTLNGSSAEVYGPVVFNGTSGTFNVGEATGGVWYQPDKITWPTVSKLADIAASQKLGSSVPTGTGLSWLRNNNDNSKIMMFSTSDASITSPTQHSWVSASFSKSSGDWVISNNGNVKTFQNVTQDTNPMDAAGATTPRYDQAAVTYTFTNPSNTVAQSEQDLGGSYVLILPGSTTSTPNNYYFDEISMQGNSSKCAILIDNASGPVNIWLGPSSDYGTTTDYLDAEIFFTAPGDSTTFRIYDGKSGTLDIGGNSVFPGGIYDYNGTGTGTINLHGNPIIDGSVIGDNMSTSGGPFINYPTNMQASNDYSLWYGFLNQWTEVSGM